MGIQYNKNTFLPIDLNGGSTAVKNSFLYCGAFYVEAGDRAVWNLNGKEQKWVLVVMAVSFILIVSGILLLIAD